MSEVFVYFFAFFCLIQTLFHWTVFYKIIGHKSVKSDDIPSTSIIIAARNEAGNLQSLVKNLQSQKHPDLEIIIVNDRSTDESEAILKDIEAKTPGLKVIHIETLPLGWKGKKHALKVGIEQSSKEVLLFTDADCMPHSTLWAAKMTTGLQHIRIGFSPYWKEAGFLNQFIHFETLMTGLQYLGMALRGKPYMAVGRNWAIRKDIYPMDRLEEIKGFEGGDDDLILNHLSKKHKVEVISDLESQTTSIPKTSWRALFKQKIRHLSVGKHYQQKDQTLLGLFTLAHVVGWLMFLTALIIAFKPHIILIIFGLRSLSFYTIFTLVGRKLGTLPNFWALPLLDLCYSLYYPIIGISAWSAKKIEWS